MGLRYRKSINLGLGFRVNISKSGVGYSWGFPGYRKSIGSSGKKRTTISMPGTGLSYSYSESNKQSSHSKKSTTKPKRKPIKTNQTLHLQDELYLAPTTEIQSAGIEHFQKGELEEFTTALSKVVFWDNFSTVLIILSALIMFVFPLIAIVLVAGIALKITLIYKYKNCITYEMDDYAVEQYGRQVQSLMDMNKCSKLWQIDSFKQSKNQKYSAGAGRLVNRSTVRFTTIVPFYLKSNLKFPNLILKRERLFFLPDKILLIRNSKVGALDYKDVKLLVKPIEFIEGGAVPRDAERIGTTWRYVNKNGTPDKRFTNNKKIPICKYGKIIIQSASGLNVELQASNYEKVKSVKL